MLTIIPGVKYVFHLETPRWFFYGIAFIFAVTSVVIDEFFKYLYRRRLEVRKQSQLDGVKQNEQTDRLNMICDMLHDLESGKTIIRATTPTTTTTTPTTTTTTTLTTPPVPPKPPKPPL